MSKKKVSLFAVKSVFPVNPNARWEAIEEIKCLLNQHNIPEVLSMSLSDRTDGGLAKEVLAFAQHLNKIREVFKIDVEKFEDFFDYEQSDHEVNTHCINVVDNILTKMFTANNQAVVKWNPNRDEFQAFVISTFKEGDIVAMNEDGFMQAAAAFDGALVRKLNFNSRNDDGSVNLEPEIIMVKQTSIEFLN